MISVVIVTKYERWDDLDNCLSALAKQKFQDFEIIIVVPKNVNPQIQDLSPTKWITHVISQGGVGISNARNCG
ncbi:MAG: glycosyltransferase, partial [Candidatus Bathyarchaeota archaeon]|nr:glycosyltransferase [Candidatus Bathyarchaeota archaeon]